VETQIEYPAIIKNDFHRDRDQPAVIDNNNYEIEMKKVEENTDENDKNNINKNNNNNNENDDPQIILPPTYVYDQNVNVDSPLPPTIYSDLNINHNYTQLNNNNQYDHQGFHAEVNTHTNVHLHPFDNNIPNNGQDLPTYEELQKNRL
jgi:hypothetical protein